MKNVLNVSESAKKRKFFEIRKKKVFFCVYFPKFKIRKRQYFRHKRDKIKKTMFVNYALSDYLNLQNGFI